MISRLTKVSLIGLYAGLGLMLPGMFMYTETHDPVATFPGLCLAILSAYVGVASFLFDMLKTPSSSPPKRETK